ncbi:hypothetical protein EX530_07520, partial [Xanthomonas phaseoli]
ADLGLLEDGNDLAVGEAGCLHETSSEKGTRKFHFWRQLTCGRITMGALWVTSVLSGLPMFLLVLYAQLTR